MREMKETSIPFCRQIPTDWTTIPNRYLFTNHSVKVGEKSSEYQLLSLTTNGVKEKDINASGGKVPTSYDNYQTVSKGDMIFCLFDLDCSAVFSGLSNYDGMITSAYDVFKPNEEYIDKHFIEYWFEYVFSYRYYKMYSKSIRYTITSDMFKTISSPVPPLEQQKLIGAFLDKKCTQIDTLISNQQQQIEKLKAYKQSLITEVVTKGLNPDVPMKDSGVEWIGEIPESWELPKIKHLSKYINSGGTPDRNHSEYWDGDVNWVKTGELQNCIINDSEEKITTIALENSSAKIFPTNTILIAMYGQGKTRGMTALLNKPCATNQACAGIVLNNEKALVQFIWIFFIGAYNAIREKAVGSGQPNLNIELISNFEVSLPPLSEQQSIVEYLDKKCSEIDNLIAVKQQKIEKLQQYKKSVIYEYVTGKKEVE